jgi:hypothetical protein
MHLLKICFSLQQKLSPVTMTSMLLQLVARLLTSGLSNYPHRAWLGCQAWWGSFFLPSPFWARGFFLVFFLLNLGSAAPNYSTKPLLRSSKAPPKQKNRGRFYPTLTTPSRTWPPSHGFLDTSPSHPLPRL